MKGRPGNDDLLFRKLADAQDRHASRIILYITPPISNPEKKGNIHNLVMEISKAILKLKETLLEINFTLQSILLKNSTRKKQAMSEQ